jgi:hypothetical protein
VEKKTDRKVEITKKGHLWNGVECQGGEQFDVTEELLKQLVADGIGKDVTPESA